MKKLINEALKAREKAYAPYSKFKVGAALETLSGKIYTGCNVENASYGLSNCAERTAIFKAVSEGHKKFKRIAIVTGSTELASPCGACRQVPSEFAPEIEIVLANTKGKVMMTILPELFPMIFKLRS